MGLAWCVFWLSRVFGATVLLDHVHSSRMASKEGVGTGTGTVVELPVGEEQGLIGSRAYAWFLLV